MIVALLFREPGIIDPPVSVMEMLIVEADDDARRPSVLIRYSDVK